MEPPTTELLQNTLFKHHYEDATRLEHVERSYARARAIGRHYRMSDRSIIQYRQLTSTRHDT